MQKVVGYIRVSTGRQGEEGISLDEQAHMLRGFCDEKKLDLVSIEEDDRSAAGAQGHAFRPGLQQAVMIAKKQGAKILVPSVDRLARNPGVLTVIYENNLQVISIADGRRLGQETLKRLIDRACRERDLISQRVRDGAARAKVKGVKLGNRTNLPVAQRRGAISNVARADRKAEELADFIERTPGWDKMTLRNKKELLNRFGPRNLISEKRDERRLWTESSLRKPLKRAEEVRSLREDMEDEPVIIAPSWAWDASQDKSANDQDLHAVHKAALDEDMPVADAYKDHPEFGKF